MSLGEYSIDELEAEIARREEPIPTPLPTPLPTPEWESLRNLCIGHVEEVAEDPYAYDDDDIDHYIYEAAMEAVYGSDIWKWMNKQVL